MTGQHADWIDQAYSGARSYATAFHSHYSIIRSHSIITVARDLSISAICKNALCNFEIAHEQYANF